MGSCREDLDEALADVGEDLTLRRYCGESPNQANVDVTVRALVRREQTTELVGGIAQVEWTVVISPTQIMAAQWPGGEPSPATSPDPSRPRRLDRLIDAFGFVCTIETADPIVVDGELVRYNIKGLG